VKSTVSIPPVSSAVASDSDRKCHVVAWLLCLTFYSMEYASRSSPSVMVPELSLYVTLGVFLLLAIRNPGGRVAA
jgi:hypothetical protein